MLKKDRCKILAGGAIYRPQRTQLEQTDEKPVGETGHVCVLASGANTAEYG